MLSYNINMNINRINISVTSLAEYYSRSGDLSSLSFGSVSAIEGTRLHTKIFKDLSSEYGDDFSSEYYFKIDYPGNGIILNVSGRADVLLKSKIDGSLRIIEIKSFNSSKNSFEKLVRDEHLSQLKLYGAMYLLLNDNIDSIKMSLRYVSTVTLEYYENDLLMTRDEAEVFFSSICDSYISFALKLFNYEKTSLKSIKETMFPYDVVRPGQKEFMKHVLRSLTCKEALFVEAPTGTGKTISTLYPAIKGLLKHSYSKVFYLTAKTATRIVAHKAINDMRSKGLIIRSILLESKQKMCPLLKKCDAKYCEFSKGYYSRLKPALDEVLMNDDITPDLIARIAMKHKICPHELSLDALNYSQVVIGDYNHAFDPRVSLCRCFEDSINENAILVDEAHNLVDRARSMYSASFSTKLLDNVLSEFKDVDKTINKYLMQARQYFTVAQRCLLANQSAFFSTEGVDEKKVLKSDLWEGTRQTPKNLYGILWKACRFLSPVLDSMPDGKMREVALEFFFETRFFLTVLEQYFDDSYISSFSKKEDEIIISLTCLDSSSKLNSLIENQMGVVFFSATLSPYEYYKCVLVGKNADYCRSLNLPYPFPRENLDVIIDSSISTVYKDRAITAQTVADRIYDELENRKGNYIIYFSSFEYENKIVNLLNESLDIDEVSISLIRQKTNMTIQEKAKYLQAFQKPSDGLLIGTAVLGGMFGEGIDLVGEKLSGVIIVGVGIPKITPERQLLSNYYSEKFGDGFSFAYRYPGWEKVLQAVGRVIRTENDTGFALLIDDRLEKPEYISLYPEHWNTN